MLTFVTLVLLLLEHVDLSEVVVYVLSPLHQHHGVPLILGRLAVNNLTEKRFYFVTQILFLITCDT